MALIERRVRAEGQDVHANLAEKRSSTAVSCADFHEGRGGVGDGP